MLDGLPPLMELRGAGKLDLMWFNASAMCFAREQIPTQDSAEIMSKLLELLFVHVLREWAEHPAADQVWLTGVVDPVIRGTIAAIHAEPEARWTVERLAAKSNLSRSAFAERFARRVGQSPAAYVTQLRLERAADLLLYTKEPVVVIATSTGYDSGAAFSRAFSRRYGMSPSRWRHRGRTLKGDACSDSSSITIDP
jgi:transcriptional regulator GlxA family with amidase domain